MNVVEIVGRSGEHDSLEMDTTVMRVVPLQFAVPLLILGNLNRSVVTPGCHQSAPVSSQSPFTLPVNYTAFPEIGAAYKFVESKLSWHNARRHCVSEGGNLAVFDSQQKLHIGATLGYSVKFNAWIGIHSFYDPKEWVSVRDGSRVTFFSWFPGWPKDSKTRPCIGVNYDGVRDVRHYNVACTESEYFFCEIPIRKTSPALA